MSTMRRFCEDVGSNIVLGQSAPGQYPRTEIALEDDHDMPAGRDVFTQDSPTVELDAFLSTQPSQEKNTSPQQVDRAKAEGTEPCIAHPVEEAGRVGSVRPVARCRSGPKAGSRAASGTAPGCSSNRCSRSGPS